MKTREGFVSNSSSTSFIIAFAPEEGNLNLKTFGYVLSLNGNNLENLSGFKETVKQRKDTLEKELKTYQRDVEWIKDYIDKLTECCNIPSIQLIMDSLDSLPPKTLNEHNVRYSRKDYRNGKWKDSVFDQIDGHKAVMNKINRSIITIKHQLDLIKDMPPDSIVAGFEESHGGFLCKLAEELEKDKRIVVLEKITT